MGNLPVAAANAVGIVGKSAAILDDFDAMHRGQSLIPRLTGASSAGGAQAVSASSLGNYWSSTRVYEIGFMLTNPIPGIKIHRVAGANGVGNAILTATGANTLAFTGVDGTRGNPVTITNGQIRAIEDLDDPEKYVLVERTSANDLAGTCTVICKRIYNNIIGMSNAAQSAVEIVRCIAFRNESYYQLKEVKFWVDTLGTTYVSDAGQLGASGSGTITTTSDLSAWPSSGGLHIYTAAGALKEIVYYTSRTSTVLTVPAAGRGLLGTAAAAGAADDDIIPVPLIRLAADYPAAGAVKTASDENDVASLAALSFDSGITAATGVSVGVILPGDWVGVWIRASLPAAMTAIPKLLNAINWSYKAQ